MPYLAKWLRQEYFISYATISERITSMLKNLS